MAVKGDRVPGRVAYVNARLLDPASGLDTTGGVLTEGEVIKGVGPEVTADVAIEGVTVIDCDGHCLASGLVDMRVHLGELARAGFRVPPGFVVRTAFWCILGGIIFLLARRKRG